MFFTRPSAPKERHTTKYNDTVLPALQVCMQLTNIKTAQNHFEPDRQVIRFTFVVVIPGAQNATSQAEQDAFWADGHGKYMNVDVNPVSAMALLNPDNKVPNLYKLLAILVNDGAPLTEEQLGILPNTTAGRKTAGAWANEYKALQDARDVEGLVAFMGGSFNKDGATEEEVARLMEAKVNTFETARYMYSSAVVNKLLVSLQKSNIQVLGTPTVRVGANGVKYNNAPIINCLLPKNSRHKPDLYKPYPPAYDPREANDDPACVCSACGVALRGFQSRKGDWITNKQWAELCTKKYGTQLCGKCVREATPTEAPLF